MYAIELCVIYLTCRYSVIKWQAMFAVIQNNRQSTDLLMQCEPCHIPIKCLVMCNDVIVRRVECSDLIRGCQVQARLSVAARDVDRLG